MSIDEAGPGHAAAADKPGVARSTRPMRPVAELLADPDYRAQALEDAVNRLRNADEDMSASVAFSRIQKIIGFTLLGIIAVAMVIEPVGTCATLVSIATIGYVVTLADRLVIFRRGLVNGAIRVSDEDARSIPDDELPAYTVFVPAYGEPEVVGQLVAAMETIEYPRDKLQVLLLLEEDDCPVPLHDTTAIHVDQALDWMLTEG